MNARRWMNLVAVVAMLAAFAPVGQVEAGKIQQGTVERGTQYVPGEVLVTFDEGISVKERGARANALAGALGAQVVESYDNLAVLSFAADADVPALADQLAQSGGVTAAQPNYLYWIPEDGSERSLQAGTMVNRDYQAQVQPGQTRALTREQLGQMRTVTRRSGRAVIRSTFPVEAVTSAENTWGWDRVNGEIIWANASASPAVCVVDTGVDAKHKDLSGRVVNGYDFVNDDSLPADDNGHGTHVAGTAAAVGNNGGTTAIGVSNGKVVAVKALNAQGWGTTFSIAAGVRFCAARADVRIINLSLGSAAKDLIEYNALKYAIVDKGKVVVAAAGNTYSSDLEYPAAYGDPEVTAPGGGANEIDEGVISVAAARINPPTYPVWVDTNGDGIWKDYTVGDTYYPETYEYDDCAVSFTNYGKHINIVAPGHLIYSTTPTSYPFFNQYYYGDRAGYETYSGTSMAAPFVSGAAARVLSLFPNLGKAGQETIKQRLLYSGKGLTYAVDPMTGEAGFNPAHPYDYKVGDQYYFNNGVAKEWMKDGTPVMAIKAPFCWPNATAPYTAAQDMSNARYLNVAAAMERFGVIGEIFDASTALPLKDATVRIFKQNGVIVDTVKVGAQGATMMLMNLPMSFQDPQTHPVFYYLQVSKAGYTSGYQTYGYIWSNFTRDDPLYGEVSFYPTSSVAVPPAKDISAVLNWLPYADANLDLYLWTPQDSAMPGYISTGWMRDYHPDYAGAPDLGLGTLLPPSAFGGTVSPYAQLIHDGGNEGVASDILPFDTITIKAKPNTSLPWYSGTYQLMVTDYSRTYADTNLELGVFPMKDYLTYPKEDPGGNGSNKDYRAPVLRVWKKGKLAFGDIIQLFDNGVIGANCENLSIDWWHAADITGSAVTPGKACGDAQEGSGMYLLPEYP